jgi:hypothetical protein
MNALLSGLASRHPPALPCSPLRGVTWVERLSDDLEVPRGRRRSCHGPARTRLRGAGPRMLAFGEGEMV